MIDDAFANLAARLRTPCVLPHGKAEHRTLTRSQNGARNVSGSAVR